MVQYFLDDVFGSNIFGFSLISEANTVPHHILRNRTYIFRYHKTTVFYKCQCLGRLRETDTCPWRSAIINKRLQIRKAVVFWCTTGKNEVYNILFNFFIHIYLAHHFASFDNGFRLYNRVNISEIVIYSLAQDQFFFFGIGIGDNDLHQEPVNLGFG